MLIDRTFSEVLRNALEVGGKRARNMTLLVCAHSSAGPPCREQVNAHSRRTEEGSP